MHKILIATVFLSTFLYSKSAPRNLALIHVTVIDCTGTPAPPDMTVLMAGGRIAAIGKSADVAIPSGAKVVDSTGKFLIPGLWDMHGHLTDATQTAQFLGKLETQGTIEKGKIADLVLLDANPLEDISHRRKINSVVLGGRLFPIAKMRDEILNSQK